MSPLPANSAIIAQDFRMFATTSQLVALSSTTSARTPASSEALDSRAGAVAGRPHLAVLARRRRVGLRERIEKPRLHRLRNTDSGIANLETKADFIRCFRLPRN